MEDQSKKTNSRNCFNCGYFTVCKHFDGVHKALQSGLFNIDGDAAPMRFGDVYVALASSCLRFKEIDHKYLKYMADLLTQIQPNAEELSDFDHELAQKDVSYAVEWGMKKQKKAERQIIQTQIDIINDRIKEISS